MRKILEALKSLRRDAAIEAGKLTFAILGVGSTLADFSQMHLWLMLPAGALLLATWGAIYRMCE
jgi:hypothetical protein